ncbi:hypothetical protein TRIP_C20723 [Candidatus Zixiibacteriota bacterium]|nr:hypothetical protein TRIP_C20723 [candidate division Zixibacteria bacterium]
MPCSNYTELLKLALDKNDCIARFGLKKASCGQTVGGAILLPYIKGLKGEHLLEGRLRDFVPDLDKFDPQESFLLFKQFYSLRAALSVLLGRTNGGRDEAFVIDQVDYDDNGTSLYGMISVAMVAKDMEACEGCGCQLPKLTE